MHLAQLTITSPSTIFTTAQSPNVIGIFVSRLLFYAIPVAGIYFFIRLVLSGYSYMSSLGDPAKVQAAHMQIVYALYGLIIVLSVFFIAQAIQYIFHLNFI